MASGDKKVARSSDSSAVKTGEQSTISERRTPGEKASETVPAPGKSSGTKAPVTKKAAPKKPSASMNAKPAPATSTGEESIHHSADPSDAEVQDSVLSTAGIVSGTEPEAQRGDDMSQQESASMHDTSDGDEPDETSNPLPAEAALHDESAIADDARTDTGTYADDVDLNRGDDEDDEEFVTRASTRPREEITAPRASEQVDPDTAALVARGLVKSFSGVRAVDEIDLTIPAGTFYGLVGPNGAGKTTTLSMLAGLLRPDAGAITVGGIDARADSRGAKKLMGVLPDRFRTFDRLTGHQLLHYYGVLRGLKPAVVEQRTADLARAFDLTAALGRVVSDYSAGMTKKVMLAGALIHSPRVLVLDEPFESVDPVSSAAILDILTAYVSGGGTVILSSHGMDLVERVCSRLAVIVGGRVIAEGTVDDVRAGMTLEQRFVELAGGSNDVGGLEWLHTFSD